VRSWFIYHLSKVVGNGCSTLYWHESWREDPLRYLLSSSKIIAPHCTFIAILIFLFKKWMVGWSTEPSAVETAHEGIQSLNHGFGRSKRNWRFLLVNKRKISVILIILDFSYFLFKTFYLIFLLKNLREKAYIFFSNESFLLSLENMFFNSRTSAKRANSFTFKFL
jgi:hypothetical protein